MTYPSKIICVALRASGRAAMRRVAKSLHGSVSGRNAQSLRDSTPQKEHMYWITPTVCEQYPGLVPRLRHGGVTVVHSAGALREVLAAPPDEMSPMMSRIQHAAHEQTLRDELESIENDESMYDEDCNCTCHCGNPPCGQCTHEGHPEAIENRMDDLYKEYGNKVVTETMKTLRHEESVGGGPTPPPYGSTEWRAYQAQILEEGFSEPTINQMANGPEESKMLKIENVTRINGMDIGNVSVETLISIIAEEQAHVDKLVEMKLATKSTAVKDIMAKHKSNIDALTEILDEKYEAESKG